VIYEYKLNFSASTSYSQSPSDYNNKHSDASYFLAFHIINLYNIIYSAIALLFTLPLLIYHIKLIVKNNTTKLEMRLNHKHELYSLSVLADEMFKLENSNKKYICIKNFKQILCPKVSKIGILNLIHKNYLQSIYGKLILNSDKLKSEENKFQLIPILDFNSIVEKYAENEEDKPDDLNSGKNQLDIEKKLSPRDQILSKLKLSLRENKINDERNFSRLSSKAAMITNDYKRYKNLEVKPEDKKKRNSRNRQSSNTTNWNNSTYNCEEEDKNTAYNTYSDKIIKKSKNKISSPNSKLDILNIINISEHSYNQIELNENFKNDL
jgi:hypothetical protein